MPRGEEAADRSNERERPTVSAVPRDAFQHGEDEEPEFLLRQIREVEQEMGAGDEERMLLQATTPEPLAGRYAELLERAAAAFARRDEGHADLDKAVSLRRRAYDATAKRYGAEHALAAQSLHALGDTLALAASRAEDEAQRYLERARRLRKASLGPAHPDTLESHRSSAALFARRGMHKEALGSYIELQARAAECKDGTPFAAAADIAIPLLVQLVSAVKGDAPPEASKEAAEGGRRDQATQAAGGTEADVPSNTLVSCPQPLSRRPGAGGGQRESLTDEFEETPRELSATPLTPEIAASATNGRRGNRKGNSRVSRLRALTGSSASAARVYGGGGSPQRASPPASPATGSPLRGRSPEPARKSTGVPPLPSTYLSPRSYRGESDPEPRPAAGSPPGPPPIDPIVMRHANLAHGSVADVENWAQRVATRRLEELWEELGYPQSERARIRRELASSKPGAVSTQWIGEEVDRALALREATARAWRHVRWRESFLEEVQERQRGAISAGGPSMARLRELSEQALTSIWEWQNSVPWNNGRPFLVDGVDYARRVRADLKRLL